jgi:Protein of unknown function (DUF2971)
VVSDSRLPGILHHYTGRAGLVGIIESRTLWATHIRYLNDESEVRYSRELLERLAEQLRSEYGDDWAGGVVCNIAALLAKASTSPDTFVASLCDDGDNLGQWRGYGAQGGGFAIGFNRERLRQVAQAQDYQLVRLMYLLSEQEAQLEKALRDAVEIVGQWGDPLKAPPALEQLLSLGLGFTFATLSIKNPYFRDEKEWRLVHMVVPGLSDGREKTRTDGGLATPYEEVELADHATGETPIIEVVIGPMARSEPSVAEVRRLLDQNGMDEVEVRESIGPLRRWIPANGQP